MFIRCVLRLKRLAAILPALISELSDLYGVELDEEEKSREEALRKCVHSLCSSVEEIGVNPLVGEIASKCSSDKEGARVESCWMMQVIVEESKFTFIVTSQSTVSIFLIEKCSPFYH